MFMKKSLFFLMAVIMMVSVFGLYTNVKAQSGPVLYFCERYDENSGEVNISDRFTTGYITVMVKCSYELGLSNVSIQFDKLDFSTGKFKYYKKFSYKVEPSMKYIYFSKNSESDLSFDTPGIYRVFLLDSYDKTVCSGLIEIIR